MEEDFQAEEMFEVEPGHGFEGDGVDLGDAGSPYAFRPLPGDQPLLSEVDGGEWL